jgi:hypothetical protein
MKRKGRVPRSCCVPLSEGQEGLYNPDCCHLAPPVFTGHVTYLLMHISIWVALAQRRACEHTPTGTQDSNRPSAVQATHSTDPVKLCDVLACSVLVGQWVHKGLEMFKHPSSFDHTNPSQHACTQRRRRVTRCTSNHQHVKPPHLQARPPQACPPTEAAAAHTSHRWAAVS